MGETRTIGATELKAKCLDILDRLSSRELERVTVTKHGRVVAVMLPPDTALSARQVHGFMSGRAIIPDGFDLTEPVLDEPLDAEKGILHR